MYCKTEKDYHLYLDDDLINDLFDNWALFDLGDDDKIAITSLKRKDWTAHSYYPLALQKWMTRQNAWGSYNF